MAGIPSALDGEARLHKEGAVRAPVGASPPSNQAWPPPPTLPPAVFKDLGGAGLLSLSLSLSLGQSLIKSSVCLPCALGKLIKHMTVLAHVELNKT